MDNPLPPITDEDRQFLHYNPNTDDIVAWVRSYAESARAEVLEVLRELWESADPMLPSNTDHPLDARFAAAWERARSLLDTTAKPCDN